MPLAVIERAMAVLPQVDFTNAYGLTETSATICILTPDDHRAAAASTEPHIRQRLGSVGRAIGTVEIEIRDEDGAVLPPGAPGHIHARGSQVAASISTPGARWTPTAGSRPVTAASWTMKVSCSSRVAPTT